MGMLANVSSKEKKANGKKNEQRREKEKKNWRKVRAREKVWACLKIIWGEKEISASSHAIFPAKKKIWLLSKKKKKREEKKKEKKGEKYR